MTAIRQRLPPALAAAIPALLYLGYVSRYAVNAPNADDWNVLGLADHAVHHTLTWSDLWDQYGNTRLFVARIFFAIFAVSTHLNQRSMLLFGAVVYIATFAILLVLFRSYLQRRLTFWPVLFLAVVWFTIADVQNALWAFQMAWYLVVFFFVAMVSCLVMRHGHPNLFLGMGIAAAVLASLTEVQGFAVWAVGVICLLWASPRGRRTYYELSAWLTAAALTIVVYLIGFDLGSGTSTCIVEGGKAKACSLSYSVGHPVELGRFLTVLVGNVVPSLPLRYVGAHQLLGVAILVAAGFVVVQSIREHPRRPNALPVLLIVFAVQFDLMIASTRLGQGVYGAGKNWYTMPNVILLTAIVVFAAGHVPRWERAPGGSRRRAVLGMVGVATLVVFLVVQCFIATKFGITNGRFQKDFDETIARVAVNLDRIPGEQQACIMTNGIPGTPPGVVKAGLYFMYLNHLSVFAPGTYRHYRALGPPEFPQCGPP